ncbi:hypothetical protein BCT69_03985 [Enterovibrio norvegicus]|nr:hypothetical protein BCT69_03985 [Enterovibrio norvegicus]
MNINWLINTILIGMIPILIRGVIYFATNGVVDELFVASDFIILGLVIHISIINEANKVEKRSGNKIEVLSNISSLFVISYSIGYSLTIYNEKLNVDMEVLTASSQGLCVVSALIGYVIMQRLTYIENPECEVTE